MAVFRGGTSTSKWASDKKERKKAFPPSIVYRCQLWLLELCFCCFYATYGMIHMKSQAVCTCFVRFHSEIIAIPLIHMSHFNAHMTPSTQICLCFPESELGERIHTSNCISNHPTCVYYGTGMLAWKQIRHIFQRTKYCRPVVQVVEHDNGKQS